MKRTYNRDTKRIDIEIKGYLIESSDKTEAEIIAENLLDDEYPPLMEAYFTQEDGTRLKIGIQHYSKTYK